MKTCSKISYTSLAVAAALGSSLTLLSPSLFAATPVRAAVMPAGAEVTGLHTNDAGDVFLNAQHPGGKNVFGADVPPAIIGYMAGFNPDALSGEGMAIPDESAHGVVNVANGEYVTFGYAGDKMGSGEILGGVYSAAGELMYVSNTPDFNGFIPRDDNSAYLYTGWEGAGRDGASAVSRLALAKVDGKWQADLKQSRNVDLSSVDGGAVLCSGTVTPWGTPLLAEEYFFYDTSTWNHPDNHDADEKIFFRKGNDINYIKPKNMSEYVGKMSNPYRYGYMIEIVNAASHSAEVPIKHYATGRLSHETAAIMPDHKTLYMTDDDSAVYAHKDYNTASGGVLFKFVADTAGDLSAGTLFAAKLKQDSSADPHTAGFDVTWIELGSGNNAEIASWIAEYDSVTVADYKDGETNYISDKQIVAYAESVLNADTNGDEIIGKSADARAAFLESRRTAAAMGATQEWDKLEGVTSHGNDVYISASAIAFTMDKSWGHKNWSTGIVDQSVAGDIALNAEGCGATYKSVTDANYNITRIDPYVVGKTLEDGSCDLSLPANPDNILALNNGMLMIGEDAGPKRHVLDMLWLVK